jgi:predicted heme/steroid binding protein
MTLPQGLPHNWLEPATQALYLGDKGVTQVAVFGHNHDVSTSEVDVWEGGANETLLTAGVAMSIACEDDTYTGTIMVSGLDENWAPALVPVVCTGQTEAPISGLWTRIHTAFPISTAVPGDDLWIAETSDSFTLGVPDTQAKIHLTIDVANGENQARKGMYTVPAGYKVMVSDLIGDIVNAASGSARTASVFIEAQFLAAGATVANPSWAPFRRFVEMELAAPGHPIQQLHPAFPTGPFPELTNIHIRAKGSAACEIGATLVFLLIKDD